VATRFRLRGNEQSYVQLLSWLAYSVYSAVQIVPIRYDRRRREQNVPARVTLPLSRPHVLPTTMKNPAPIRKQVGRPRQLRPLERAFFLRTLILPFTKAGLERQTDIVRRVVGRSQPPRR